MKFVYTGIRVQDMERALDFYTRIMGMRVTHRVPIEETGGEVAGLRSAGSAHELELNFYPPGSRFWSSYEPGEGLDHLAFNVQDADATYGELVAKGAQPALEPFDEGGWRLAYIRDPDGNWIELESRIRARAKRPQV